MQKKRVIVGDFVTRSDADGTWMVTTIAKNYELNVIQARVIRVGDPKIIDFVNPETLTVITKNF